MRSNHRAFPPVSANEKAAARSPSKLRLLVEELGATIASVKDELDVRHYSVHLDGLLSRTMTMLSSFASTQASRLAGRASLVRSAATKR